MWIRSELKTRAKDVLRISYWKAFLVSLILGFVGGSGGGSGFSFPGNFGNNSNEYSGSIGQGNEEMFWTILIIGIIVFLAIMIFAFAFRVFLGYPLEVGGRRFFTQAAHNDANLNYLGYGFAKGRYMDIIKAMLYKGVLNFLWTLLLIIPGIIKGYAYSMVPYLLADNPNIGYKRALDLSNKMTQGHKWDMFILDLSFIGWYILGLMACFIGVLFVHPYYNATKAELYFVLRQNALDSGMSSSEELMLTPAIQPEI